MTSIIVIFVLSVGLLVLIFKKTPQLIEEQTQRELKRMDRCSSM